MRRLSAKRQRASGEAVKCQRRVYVTHLRWSLLPAVSLWIESRRAVDHHFTDGFPGCQIPPREWLIPSLGLTLT